MRARVALFAVGVTVAVLGLALLSWQLALFACGVGVAAFALLLDDGAA